MADRIICL